MLKRFVTKRTAKKLLIAGGAGFVAVTVFSIFALLNIYAKAGDCGGNNSCQAELAWEPIAGKLIMVLGYLSIASLITGTSIFIALAVKSKK